MPQPPATRYVRAARTLHWSIAILFLLATGLALFRETFAPYAAAMITAHKLAGLAILALVVARLAIGTLRPPAPAGRGWERMLAKAVHRSMLTLLLLVPAAGWAFVSLAPDSRPLDYRGARMLDLPLSRNDPASFAWHEAHELAGFALLALFAIHLAGFLRHQLRPHDRILSRMLGPRGDGRIAWAAFVVLALWAAGLALDFLNVRFWS